ncbi:MAG: FtsW/RodA/SpoVE family cell cycle protein [Oscillospiraceae bacterium]|jgi:rod shape determining protein RodA|nr:FtsW/RodA/SpoVE family cell cycle protein [Oscillospiraceae bacterium]
MKTIWKAVKDFFKTADIFLLVVCLLAAAYGVVLISSAGRVMLVTAETGQTVTVDNAARLVTVQCAAIAIGVVLFVILSCVPLDLLARLWKWLLGFNILFVALLQIWGVELLGNRSWLKIPGFPVLIQPAEVVKVTFILVLAKQLSEGLRRDRLNRLPSVALLAGHLGLMVGTVFLFSKDLGMVVVYVAIFFVMCLFGGLKLRWFAAAAAVIAGACPFAWRMLADHQRQRLLVGFNPSADPLGYGWQAIQSKIAIGGGQLTGQGLYNGVQTQLGRLSQKESDFIFAVAGEELGLVGCLVILLLLAVIVLRCLYAATRSKTPLATVVCVGVAGMVLFQSVINVGMCLALTPVIGLTLPFFSYGGSSIITMFAAMGLVSSAYRHPKTHLLSDEE